MVAISSGILGHKHIKAWGCSQNEPATQIGLKSEVPADCNVAIRVHGHRPGSSYVVRANRPGPDVLTRRQEFGQETACLEHSSAKVDIAQGITG